MTTVAVALAVPLQGNGLCRGYPRTGRVDLAAVVPASSGPAWPDRFFSTTVKIISTYPKKGYGPSRKSHSSWA